MVLKNDFIVNSPKKNCFRSCLETLPDLGKISPSIEDAWLPPYKINLPPLCNICSTYVPFYLFLKVISSYPSQIKGPLKSTMHTMNICDSTEFYIQRFLATEGIKLHLRKYSAHKRRPHRAGRRYTTMQKQQELGFQRVSHASVGLSACLRTSDIN